MGLEKNVLSPESVCLILYACSRSQVRSLKFAGLVVEFGRPAEEVTLPMESQATPATLAEMAVSENRNTKAALESDENKLREEQIEYLRITDPIEYERMMRDGELGEDDADGPADDGAT